MDIIKEIPQNLLNGIIIIVLSLLIGMEQRRHYTDKSDIDIFGTDRTFTLIGILGFVLYIISPQNLYIFWSGAGLLTVFLGIYYYQKVKQFNRFGITTIIVAYLTYLLAPLVYTQQGWLVLLIVVIILVLVQVKEPLKTFAQKFEIDEFYTISKFIIIAGIILPLLPKVKIFSFLELTPYSIWFSVVVISGISYFSYLLNKFVVKKGGITASGILGGIYSSTATTLIMSRKSKELKTNQGFYSRAILLATGAMYLRILVIIFIFNYELAIKLLPVILGLAAFSVLVAFFLPKMKQSDESNVEYEYHDKNPLELRFALLFALLFVLFSIVTYFTLQYFGSSGLRILSLVIGVTDIDPFLLNLFQGGYHVSLLEIGSASLLAITSNNLMKLIYTYFLADREVFKTCLKGFSLIIILNIIGIFLIYLI